MTAAFSPQRWAKPAMVRRSCLFMLLTLIFSSPAAADPKTIIALEARLSAALSAYDARAVDALWDDQLVFVFPNGRVATKAERLAALVPPKEARTARLVAVNDAVEVRYEDKRSAVVLIRSSWRKGGETVGQFVATHVWAKRKKEWKLVAAQVAEASPMP